jgi:hypothetical protein
MLAVAETAVASDMDCKKRCSPAMAEEKPGGEAAEDALQEKKAALPKKKAALPKKKAGLLVLQEKKMYVAIVPLKKGGSDTKLKIIECVRLCLN